MERGPLKTDNLHYNQQQDKVYCPMGQPMDRIADRKSKSKAGDTQTQARYQARNCHGCPLRSSVMSKDHRVVEINYNLKRHKKKARENLQSEQGLKHRSKRPWDVAATFAAMKHNRGFRRFMLKGLQRLGCLHGHITWPRSVPESLTEPLFEELNEIGIDNLTVYSKRSRLLLRRLHFWIKAGCA